VPSSKTAACDGEFVIDLPAEFGLGRDAVGAARCKWHEFHHRWAEQAAAAYGYRKTRNAGRHSILLPYAAMLTEGIPMARL
jgi:hypothetical protein